MYRVRAREPIERYSDDNIKLNILIVDDDEHSRESLRYILSIAGHNITTLDEGMKCLNRCSTNRFDLIFMDYHINDLDGEITGSDISKMIKEYFEIDTPIYAYTGDNSLQAINEFKKNNMTGAFIKPVEPSLIHNFLKQVSIKKYNTQLPILARKNKNFLYFGRSI